MINSLADELNKIILKSNHNILKMLTDFGKKLYFPRGILRQTTEADKKALYYNTTSGIAKENGDAMHLDSIMNHFWDISPEKVLTYAPTLGIPELREKWKEKLFYDNPSLSGKKISNPLVTSGITHGLSLTADLFISYGDVVLLPDKLLGNYDVIFSVRRGTNIQRYSILSADSNGFDLDNFRENLLQCAPRGKVVVILNFPNNPTGYALSHKELNQIAEIVRENDLYLITDEVYENYVYDGYRHISPASLDGMFERTITTNAMSKLFSATGFRLGYVVAKKEIIDLMEKFHQYTAAGTNHPAQYGFIEALKMEISFFDVILKSFNERRLFVYNRLKQLGFDVVKPKGAFYIMPSVKNFNINGSEFSKKMMQQQGVAVIPGDTFGSFSNDRIRISYATEMSKLENAMDRIEKFVK